MITQHDAPELNTNNPAQGYANTGPVPIRVVADTNVLFNDPFIRGVFPQAIIHAAKFLNIKLAFADITVDELRNIAKEQIY